MRVCLVAVFGASNLFVCLVAKATVFGAPSPFVCLVAEATVFWGLGSKC